MSWVDKIRKVEKMLAEHGIDKGNYKSNMPKLQSILRRYGLNPEALKEFKEWGVGAVNVAKTAKKFTGIDPIKKFTGIDINDIDIKTAEQELDKVAQPSYDFSNYRDKKVTRGYDGTRSTATNLYSRRADEFPD